MFRRNRLSDPIVYEWSLEFIDAPPAWTDDDIRRIVREELAEFMPIEVPDAPPEDLQ